MFYVAKKPVGFTLIELLIVVAIIAILAAIAVPNFLEAQTRAKISRVMSDLRTYDTAASTYRIDHNKFPPTWRTTQTRKWMTKYLTTPIAYIHTALPDPFNTVATLEEDRYIVAWGKDYFTASTSGEPVDINLTHWPRTFVNFPNISNGTRMSKDDFFFMFSLGPDQKFDVSDPVFPTPVAVYDATNGTISRGDITRISG